MKERQILELTLRNRTLWILSEDNNHGHRQHTGYIDGMHVVTERTKHEVCRQLLTLAV